MAAELEAQKLSERVTGLTFAEERAKDLSTEVTLLREQQVEIVAQLEAVRKEKTTLQVWASRGGCGCWAFVRIRDSSAV